MSWANKIAGWASWTSDRLLNAKVLPNPRYWIPDVPWSDDVRELVSDGDFREQLREAIEAVMGADDAFAARFVGLNLCHELVHADSFLYSEFLLEDARRFASESYRRLVAVLQPGDVPPDKRHLDWELRLCSPLRMWDRADTLLERLNNAEPSVGDIDAIRAQHLFIRRYFPRDEDSFEDACVSDPMWSAKIVSEDMTVEYFMLIAQAIAFTNPVTEVDAPSPESVCSALEQAAWPQAPLLRPLLLNRTFFDVGMYREGIIHLNAALEVAPSHPLKKMVFGALKNVYESQGDTEQLVAFLHRWSFEFPDDHQVLMRLAGMAADSAEYEKAYKLLERAVSLSPDLERDTATRIGLTLGRIAVEATASWAELKAAITKDPTLEQTFESLVRTYWETFADLDEHERIEWITSVYAMHLLAGRASGFAPAWNRQASTAFMAVAEGRLRKLVFGPLRVEAKADSVMMRRAVTVSKETRDQDHVLAEYLLTGRISLGEMRRILERAGTDSTGSFASLLTKHLGNSPVLGQIDALQRLDQPRNKAIHELRSVDARSTHDDARRVIEATMSHRKLR